MLASRELRQALHRGGVLAVISGADGNRRAANVNALLGLVRAVEFGLDARKPLTGTQIRAIPHWRGREEIGTATARSEGIPLSRRITDLDVALRTNDAQINELIQAS